MEKTPVTVKGHENGSQPIVSIDLTLSPPSKSIKNPDVILVDSPEFPVKRVVTSTGGTRISTTQTIKGERNEYEGENGTDCTVVDGGFGERKKPKMSFPEFLKRIGTHILPENVPEYASFIEKEEVAESEPVLDVEPVSVKTKSGSNVGFSRKSQRVSVELEEIAESEPELFCQTKPVSSKKKDTWKTHIDGFQDHLRSVDPGKSNQEQKSKLPHPESFMEGKPMSAKKEEEDAMWKTHVDGFQDYLHSVGPDKPIQETKCKLAVDAEPISVKRELGYEQKPKASTKKEETPYKDLKEGYDEYPKAEEEKKPKLVQPVSSRPPSGSGFNSKNSRQGGVEDRRVSLEVIENGDFEEEPDWFLAGRTVITGLSTTKGQKLEDNEIVHFAFPSVDSRSKGGSWASARAANAASGIVRFSTKRYGEIGRLPMEWSKCLIPLVTSNKVKVLGRCVAAPANLHLMQELMLYISFYIHHSVFSVDGGKCSWKLDAPSNIDSTVYPLLTLFKLLKKSPFQKAEFTPEELDSRKRVLNLENDLNEAASVLPTAKRRKGGEPLLLEPNKDDQALSESSLNKLVGAADTYDLEEMDPPSTLACDLRPYQKQALYWMTESEKGIDVEKAEETLHPCWAAYRICDERATAIYVNLFSGEATTKFPKATEMARGGILADAMGLGKTVMTISLILARPGKGAPEVQENVTQNDDEKDHDMGVSQRPRGGTLIVCPMALLGQWKDEFETHSASESISVFVHYGGDRSNDPKVMAEPTVVLTTYGVLSASYKINAENSVFHRVDWYRVVLDEAHTIKSSKSQCAQAAFALSSYCRWCLTGTPLQNNLEDLYSLLCFLHVEPWCNWAWWNKLIQRPYENGDKRGLKLIRAILRPLMLRRTKETKDKEGRPILVLPPTDIQVIECEQSEAEHDFYDALFKRSKVQFDQFVAQGKVLHNYANILELLLRLRQCCNHPFLVMSRGDSQQFVDLSKLAKRFLETNVDFSAPNQCKAPSKAYVEEVVEGLRQGGNAECPICLELADDPVLTPCAHKMCRDCLLRSWQSAAHGFCPICRQNLRKTDLITCPSDSKFRVDVQKNWKESSKVSKLLECLEAIDRKGCGEKSIVFSQWTSFLDLLEIPLRKKKIGFLRFDGGLSQKNREKTLKEFGETTHQMVLLMSLKAGGVGLNLTAASNVFLMDPWWNPAVEEQAIMRIHRIGQQRTVCVRRFIVKDTVEERMQQVQARKQRMINGALTDEEVRSARLEELKMLFR